MQSSARRRRRLRVFLFSPNMAIPHDPDARFYYYASKERLDDAEFLVTGARNTAAIYLAGYAVECILKAAILVQTRVGQRKKVLSSFRGNKAHDYEWLKTIYLTAGGPPLPKEISKAFVKIGNWTTALRYQPRTTKIKAANLFLQSTKEILDWAFGRL